MTARPKTEYDFVRAEQAPVAAVLESLVELNSRIQAANDAGWAVSLHADKVTGLVNVDITRTAWGRFDPEPTQ